MSKRQLVFLVMAALFGFAFGRFEGHAEGYSYGNMSTSTFVVKAPPAPRIETIEVQTVQCRVTEKTAAGDYGVCLTGSTVPWQISETKRRHP